MPAFISGYRTTTYVLNNPGTQNPATVTQFGTINIGATAAAYTPGILGTNGFSWTLTNNGTVQSLAPSGVGVNFQAGGSISNVPVVGTAGVTGGIIRGIGNAVQITGGVGTVGNSGTIAQIGVAQANGVLLGSGGTVSNTGTISSAANSSNAINLGNSGAGRVINGVSGSGIGLVSGYFHGILAGTGAGSSNVTNYGTIQGTSITFSSAITVQSGTVTNMGRITALTSGVSFASTIANSGTVTNSGTISATTTGSNSNTVVFSAGGIVQNSGAITNAGAAGFAINAGNGPATITNQAGALISANTGAILTGTVGGGSNVSNFGTIRSTGFGYTAVQLFDGGTITNGTTPGSAALITGGNGVNVSNAAGAVSNFGTISGTAGTALNFANGGSVNNAGLITASATGVFFSGAGETVVNSGSIVGASAVTLNIGGSINNSGLINSTSGGVNINNAVGTLTNTGSITGTGDAVRLNAGGSVTNGVSGSSAGLIRGANGGVYAFLNPSTVTNFGTIQQAGSFADDAVYLGNGGLVTNAGLISAGFDGIDIRGSGTVINSGVIQGGGSGNFAGLFLSGSSSLLTNTGVITSTAPGVIINGSGAVSNGAGGATGASITGGTFGVTISGTGTVANYGTITATGTAFADGVSVRSGTVINTGLITSVASGTGTVNGAGAYLGGGSTLTNSGRITNPAANNGIGVQIGGSGDKLVNSAGGLISAFHDGVGFFGSGTLTLNNYGTIQSTQVAAAPVTGFNGFGVQTGNSSAATITNTGIIQSFQTSGGAGILLNGGGLITNGQKGSPAGLIQGAAFGIQANNVAATLVNFGAVQSTATGTVGEAVSLNAGGTITNYGFIAGARLPTVTGGVTGYAASLTVANSPGTITNFGSIATTNSVTNGINLLSGGVIVNGSPGATAATISAVRSGIYVGGKLNVPYPNAPGLITNYGTIASSGRNGISMVSGGFITNRGLITAYRNGISLTSAAGTIANFGTIAHTGAGTVGEAVYLGAGGVVTNYGLITGARAGAPQPIGYPGALEANNQAAVVTNLGTIANLNNGNGVNLLAGGTLVNGSSSNTSATIFAPRGGIYIGGSSGTPILGAVGYATNYGAIINTGSATPAIRMVSGGAVTNRGGIASGRTGISFANAAGTVDNSGIVVSTAATSFTAGAGVYLQNGGQITNEAGGSITALRSAVLLGGTTSTTAAGALVTNAGALTGDVGIKIGLGDTGNNTIVNFGAITGTSGIAIDLGNDAASVVLEPGSQLNGAIANFHAGDSIDFAGVSAFSVNYANGSLTLLNQTTPVAQVSVSTPYVNPQFSEAPDGNGGTLVTVTPPGGPVMFDFIYQYNGSSDYYYGKVADDGTFGLQVSQKIALGGGTYTILAQEPGAVSSPAGSVFVTYLSHAGQGESSPTPIKFAGGQPDGTNGLGSEADAVIGTDGQPHPFGNAAPPSFPVNQLFGFIFSYADGSTFYTGTVADDGSRGYGAVADSSAVIPITAAGKFQGYYTIYREGPTDQPGGKVVINRYFSGMAGQSFDVDQSVSGGSNGLGSETGVITVNGSPRTFGDPPEAVLPATNPAFAIPVIDSADPTIAAAQIYQQILGRAPDGAGLAVYAGALANGASAADVQSMIAHSPEAQHDINLMFQQVVGRDVDGSGLADYQNALAGGASLGNLRALLGQSLEAQNDLNQLYRQVLGRDGDNGGLGGYTSMIANGASLQDVRASLAHSAEAQNDLSLIYQQVLGRDGDSGGLGNYQNALASGWSLDGVRADLGHSQEAQSDLARLFSSVLGRDPNAAELAGADNRLVQGGSLQGLQNDLSTSGSAGGFTAMAAGGGDTTLAATAGPNSFLFNNAAFGNDTILGFDASQDAIVLGRAQAPDFPTVLADASQTASGTLIALGPSQSILLNGVPLSSLHANNFQFV